MSRNTRRSRRRFAAQQRAQKNSWFRRYCRALRNGVAIASIGAAGLIVQPAYAATDTWIGNTSASWNDPTNWSTSPVTGDSLIFDVAGTAGPTLLDNLMTPATYTVNGITFTANAPAYTVNSGTVGTNGFTLAGGITDNSTATQTINDSVTINTLNTITTVNGANLVFGGAMAGTGGLTNGGPGTTTIAGAAIYTGATTVAQGTFAIGATGSLGNGTTQAGAITVGNAANVNAVMKIAGNITTNANFVVAGTGANSSGAVYQSGGNFLSNVGGSTAAFQIGSGNTSYGYYNISGGTLQFNEVGVGSGNAANTGAVGVMDVTGGTVTSTAWITVGRGTSQIAELNISGANTKVYSGGAAGSNGANGEFGLNWGGAGAVTQLNVSNGALLDTNNTRIRINEAAAGSSALTVVNIASGGTIRTQRLRSIPEAGDTSIVNFDGGILKASVDNPAVAFISDSGNSAVNLPIYVRPGGATIDNSGFGTIPIQTPFLAPTGSGVSSIAVATPGSGYIGAPGVTITGGSGVGATAIATVNPATGQVTGITVTSPGNNYTTGDVLTVTLTGGGATAPATVGSIILTPNASGGMNFIGAGNTTFVAALNTYTGPTTVKGNGTLTVDANSTINSSSSVTLGDGTTTGKLAYNNVGAPLSAPVTITSGSISGSNSTINSVNVASGAANSIASNNTTTGQVTIGSLTFSGAGRLNLTTSPSTATTTVLPTTTLTANGAPASVALAPVNTTGGWSPGTFQLVSYTGALGGTGFPAYTLSMTNLGTRQTATLTNPAGLLDLVIAGDVAQWTGGVSGSWSTATLANPKNWVLLGDHTGTVTDYVAGDSVLFDDNATGSTTISVDDPNVQPALVTFNNSTKNYTISGNPIAGTGTLILNGTGTVTLNGTNTFSGGLTMNAAGTLKIGNASAIGTGRLTLAQGTTIDNSSGAALTLSTNNLQTWNGDINFTGTNALNLGTGAVTVNPNAGNATAGRETINVAANTLTIGGAVTANGGLGLNKTGPGTLVLAGGGSFPGQSFVQSTVLKVTGGTLNFSNGTAPSLAAGYTAGTSSTIIVTGGTLNLTSELWLGADAGTYGSLRVDGGAVNTGSWLALVRGVAGTNAGVGMLTINGGTVTTSSNNVTIGSFGTPALGGVGIATVNAGGTLATTGNTGVFAGENLPGTLNVLGNGTAQATVNISSTSGNGLIIGNAGGAARSIVNVGFIGATVPAGILTATTPANGLIIAPRVVGAGGANSSLNFHGGTVRANLANGAFLNAIPNAVIWNEGAILDSSTFAVTISQQLKNASGQGVNASAIIPATGTGYIDAPYVQITNATGDATGLGASAIAIVDANGNLTGIKITNPGINYTAVPTFTLVGGGGTGSITGTPTLTANPTTGGITKIGTGTVALSGNNLFTGGVTVNQGFLGINSTNAIGTGSLTIAVANAGIDNTAGATVTNASPENWNFDLRWGGTRNLNLTGPISLGGAATARSITLNNATAGQALTLSGVVSNGTGGLTLTGTGTLAIAGSSNTFTGPILISGGTFSLPGTGSANNAASITVNGAAAKLLDTSTTPISIPVSLTLGTIDGTGTGSVGNVTVANAAGAIITHGNGTQTQLNLGNVSFSGAATLNLKTSLANSTAPRLVMNGLTTNAAGNVAVNVTNSSGFWDPGQNFQLISYTGAGIGGNGFASFQKGTFNALGIRQIATLTNTAGSPNIIGVTISGDRALWTGLGDTNWDLATHVTKNWSLESSTGPTDFLANDAVVFDDSAAGPTTVNIPVNVNPAATIFKNNTKTYTLQSTTFGITSGTMVLNGTGTVIINNANTFGGGATINGGTLKLGNAAAVGSGALTINGGSIDNSTGAALTVTNTENWNGNFTFIGSNNLTFGTATAPAAVTLQGNSSVNVAANTLTVGAINGTGGVAFTGPGTLTVNSATAASNITGDLSVNNGLFQIASPTATTANNFNSGGLTGNGTIQNGGGATGQTRTLVVTNATNEAFSGILQDGAGATNAAGPAGGRLGFTKNGAGNLTLSGVSTLSDVITVGGGNLILNGSINPAVTGAVGGVVVSGTAAPNPILTVNGTLNATQTGAPSIRVGGGNGTAGALRVGPGALINSTSELWLATADGGYGVMDQTGGTVNIGSWLPLGRGGGQGVLNLSGGAINISGNPLSVGSFGGATGNGIVHGLVNISGGTLSTVSSAFAGEQSSGTINVSGTGQLVVTGATSLLRLAVANTTTVGMVNMLGGVVSVPGVNQGGGQGILNFNGGTLQATLDNFDFISPVGNTGTLNAYVYAGGAKLDDGGHNVGITIPLQAPTGNGVGLGTLVASGSGFVGTPFVQITPGAGDTTGVGAAAVANVDSNGNLTGITITNPGTGYTAVPTFTLVGGGIGNTGNLTGAASIAANTSGGINKIGSGILTLSGINTYKGPTTVTQGLLNVVSGSIDQTSKIILAGGKLGTEGTDLNLPSAPLLVTASSTIDLSNSGTVHLANSTGETWAASSLGSLLRITNWVSGNTHIFFGGAGLTGSPTTGQLGQIHFTGLKGTSQLVGGELLPSTNIVLTRGDLTGDGLVTAADLPALMSALTNESTYEGLHGYNDADVVDVGDVNHDGSLDNLDIQAEISYIITGVPPAPPLPPAGASAPTSVPEPTSVVLLGLGGVFLAVNGMRKYRKQ